MLRRLSLKEKDSDDRLARALESLAAKNQLAYSKRGKYSFKKNITRLTGVLETTKRGFGFVTVENVADDYFIPQGRLKGARHGDTVEIEVYPRARKNRDAETSVEAEIVKIVKRSRSTVIGRCERRNREMIVIPDDTKICETITIAKRPTVAIEEGDKVLIEIVDWGEENEPPTGRIIERLGKAGELSVEMRSVVQEFNLPLAFPREVTEEEERISPEIPQSEIRRRLDLRSSIIFTIDPEDAKDFDDAVSLSPMPNGNFLLGVHIADVSHYVKEGTHLEREALKRGTSVYLPNGVIPMLPERLSNTICCLKPDVDRLAYSVIMEVSPKGAVKSYEIRETVIHSQKRFTYEEAQLCIDTGDRTKANSSISAELYETLISMMELSKVIRKKRIKEGSIDFETSEIKFTFDENGMPVTINKRKTIDTNRMIEEFMLLANRVVARHIGFAEEERRVKPFLYRVHESPDPARLEELAAFVRQFGYKLDLSSGASPKVLQRLLDTVKGTKEENVINEVMIRSMAKAVYSEHNVGHYGLNFDYYAHFTSPIRRYPDLLIHQLLKEYQSGSSQEREQAIYQRIGFIAKHTSARERVAMEAEREAIKACKLEFMRNRIGEEFESIVSGVVKYGIFVELVDYLVEGLIRISEIGDDYYVFDEKQYSFIGERSGRRVRLGDDINVRLVRVDAIKREIDFVLAEKESEKKNNGKRRTGKRRR